VYSYTKSINLKKCRNIWAWRRKFLFEISYNNRKLVENTQISWRQRPCFDDVNISRFLNL